MTPCDPKEIALKSFFLGPQSENSDWAGRMIADVFEKWFSWRKALFPEDGRAISVADQAHPEFRENLERCENALAELLHRFEQEVPKFSPRYIGHMFSEISLPALFGHLVTLVHNPNNIAEESSRVGMGLEREAVALLQAMVGYESSIGTGHFTSGGTLSNIESMLRARYRLDRWLTIGAIARARGRASFDVFEAAHMGWTRHDELRESVGVSAGELEKYSALSGNPMRAAAALSQTFGAGYEGPVALIPENKHYSWTKGALTLGLGSEGIWPVSLDRYGKLCVRDLKRKIQWARHGRRPILLVVSVAGTTELGHLDPVDQVQDLLDDEATRSGVHLWHHVDAAYGGFFSSLLRNGNGSQEPSELSPASARALGGMARATSVTLDPHKLGYVPYASGAFLVRSCRDYEMFPLEIPYIDAGKQLTHGLQALEGSRSAAGAVATWLTARCIGLDAEGYGRILARTISARKDVEATLRGLHPLVHVLEGGDTNVCAFSIASPRESLSSANRRTLEIYRAFSTRGDAGFFVSKTELRKKCYEGFFDRFAESLDAEIDTDSLVLIRLVLMNPFFSSRETTTCFPQAFASALLEKLSDGT